MCVNNVWCRLNIRGNSLRAVEPGLLAAATARLEEVNLWSTSLTKLQVDYDRGVIQ